MSYRVYLGDMLLPITPNKITMSINNSNKTYDMLGIGQINVLKEAKLTDIAFEFILPSHSYSFAIGEYKSPVYYLERLERLKTKKRPFRFLINRVLPNGGILFNTNMSVSLESYSIVDSADNGTDIMVSVKLKQYKPYFTKTYTVAKESETIELIEDTDKRETDNAPKPEADTSYTVKSGDTLWKLASRYYGDGSKYMLIASANNIKNPDLINIGQVLIIPKV